MTPDPDKLDLLEVQLEKRWKMMEELYRRVAALERQWHAVQEWNAAPPSMGRMAAGEDAE